MAKPLTIVARMTARPGREEALFAALVKLIAPTLDEAGCLHYDLHRDLENPGNFLFFENWESKEQWLAHMEAPHLRDYRSVAEDLVDLFELFQMERVD